MTILLLCLAVLIVALVWRGSRVPIRHRWRSARHRREGAVIPEFPLIYAALVAAMIVPNFAQAGGKGATAEERLIAECIHRSARGKSWLEQALSGLRDQEGGWIGAQVLNTDGSHDLGPMQINSWWVPRFAGLLGQSPMHVKQWLRQDACFNVEAARWVLLNEMARTRDVWDAIGAYHSRRHSQAASYARK